MEKWLDKYQYGGKLKSQKASPMKLSEISKIPMPKTKDDSNLENVLEIVDPTGISSWDDIYRSYKETGMSPQTALEVFGALPMLGKIGKVGKLAEGVSKAFAVTGRQKRNAKVTAETLKAVGKYGPGAGRATDSYQAYEQWENGGQIDVPKAQNGIEGTMGGLTDKGFNYNGAWGGQFQDGGYVDSVLNANKNLDWVKRLYEKNTPSIQIPGVKGRSTHFMESADGRVYPTVVRMKDGKLKYLGDKAYDYADSTKTYIQFPSDKEAQWFGENYKKGKNVLKSYQVGGSLPGAVGFTYARTAGAAPSNGPYAKKTKASAQNGGEMKFYQEGLDFKPKTISQDGTVIDPMGYWNPENVGNPVIIPSNQITMEGVDQPLIGISDTGDVQYMIPGEEYEFDGDNVLELPVAKQGVSVNNADAQPLKKLDQLLNFTNYNKPTTGGWLDKYK